MGKLAGKVALVTGGNSGIGLATAKRFVREGACVFITARREPELKAAVEDIGRNVTGVQGDVSRLADLDRLFARIGHETGTLDVLFANAGVAAYAPLGNITEEHYDSIFDVNVKGLLFTVQKALPLVPDGASIVQNASTAAKACRRTVVYSATKAAVRSFARTWTTDPRDRRIRVNAVSPGSIDTLGLSDLLASAETGQQRRTMIANSVPLGRFVTPDELAKAIGRQAGTGIGRQELSLATTRSRAPARSTVIRAWRGTAFAPAVGESRRGWRPADKSVVSTVAVDGAANTPMSDDSDLARSAGVDCDDTESLALLDRCRSSCQNFSTSSDVCCQNVHRDAPRVRHRWPAPQGGSAVRTRAAVFPRVRRPDRLVFHQSGPRPECDVLNRGRNDHEGNRGTHSLRRLEARSPSACLRPFQFPAGGVRHAAAVRARRPRPR